MRLMLCFTTVSNFYHHLKWDKQNSGRQNLMHQRLIFQVLSVGFGYWGNILEWEQQQALQLKEHKHLHYNPSPCQLTVTIRKIIYFSATHLTFYYYLAKKDQLCPSIEEIKYISAKMSEEWLPATSVVRQVPVKIIFDWKKRHLNSTLQIN